MQIRSKQDFWSGVMFVALGLGFAWGATQYQMGDAARMGPVYFPFWLGICLAALGAVVTLTALSPKAEETEVTKFDFKILAIIIGSVIMFGALLRPLDATGLPLDPASGLPAGQEAPEPATGPSGDTDE